MSESDAPSDEVVSQFLAFTGSADPANAAAYLEMSGGDLETAVGLFMEHQQGGGGGPPAAAGAASLPTGAAGVTSPDVRAPDETRTMRLMDDLGGGMMPPHPLMGMLEQAEMSMSSAFAPIPADARAAVNDAAASAEQKENSQDDDDEEQDDYVYQDDDDDDDDDEVQVVQQPPRLADMFASPTHLMHQAGGFQGARSVAKDSRRWLLVNLQRDAEFSCHALNRDVWRDELVENLVREGFIFWQAFDMSPDGETYAQRYSVMSYPHLAIIDPRTGRLMWRKEGWTQENPMTPESFAELAMDFCSRHSFDKPPEAPRPPSSNGTSTAATEESSRPTKRLMTEEEQLQAAMRASLKDDDGSDSEMHDAEVQIVDKPEEDKKPSFAQQLIAMEVGEEPSEGGARIQLRMPDGKRLVRNFSGDQSVKYIYAFVAQSNDEARDGKEFVLRAGFPPRDLLSDIDNTIESCGLAGEQISVRWK